MNQLTKGVVIASTLAAAFVELYLATRLIHPQFIAIGIAGFIAAVVAGRMWPGPAAGGLLVVSCLAPTLYVIWNGFENASFEIMWALPLLGVILAGRPLHWNLPPRWRWPIVAWALVIAASWPIVFLREIDFDPGILPRPRVANTSVGISPWEVGQGLTYWMLVQNLGILWFDRLFGWYADGRLDHFRRHVLLPLASAIAVACAVGGYQGFIDLEFVNPHNWPYLRRAAGTFGDANTFGVIAAMWAPVFIVLARAYRRPWSAVVAIGGIVLCALGTLTSGSRTALLAMTVGLLAVAVEWLIAWRRAEGAAGVQLKRLAPLAIGAVAIVAVTAVALRSSSIVSVIDRGSLGYIPIFGDLGIRESARLLLWDRFGYGPAAVEMIKEHPVAGVGIGTFHTLVHDFSRVATGRDIPPDNAQNWFRHLFAELGLLGSLPWIAWVVLFCRALFTGVARHPDRFTLGALRGALVGFGLASILGVPGQSLPVVLTFWLLAFWFLAAKDAAPSDGRPQPWSTVTWAVTLALVAGHAALTFADARGELRPRHRSIRFGWDYRYGITEPERNPDGGPGRRWTDLESMSFIPIKGKVLKFVAWIDHPDADERPVHVRVWADGQIVFDDDLKRSAAIFRDIPAPPGRTHMEIRTEISRLWRPRDFGRTDPRSLGLSIRDWTWE
jgi:hypothetical protein